MFKDYCTWTLTSYQQMRADGELSIHLMRPTPGSIRKECELIYQERHTKKDEKTIKTFFGVFKEDKTHEEQIRNFDVDKFRPLVKYLKGEIEVTEDKNIELLAWLLDLQPRPYHDNHIYPELQADTKKLPAVIDDDTEKKISRTEKKRLTRLRKPILFGASLTLLVALICFGIYFFWPKKTIAMSLGGPIPPPTKGGCMIWMNDHYEALRCEDRKDQQGVLKMDSGRFAHFKRVIDTAQISEISAKKYWYYKHSGKIEYYNGPGYHPIDTARWLKQLTPYMVRKHLEHLRSN